MKPLYLSIENKETGKQEFDLSMQSSKAAIVCTQNIETLKGYLVQAFYGVGDKGQIELIYEYNGEEYIIKRNLDSNFAQLAYKEGSLISDGVEKVNEQINSHLKLSQKAFEKLVVIDSDEIYENLVKPKEDRELYIGKLLDELVFDKAEVSLIESKIKEKYDHTEMQIRVLNEVSPQELDSLKKEIKQKEVIKQDIKAERAALQDNIKSAEKALKAQEELKEEELLSEEVKSKVIATEELYDMLKVSDEAAIIDKLIEQKQSILERDKEIEQQIEELEESIKEDTTAIEKGQISQKLAEESLVGYLTRLQELRETFYDRIEALAKDEQAQQAVIAEINKFYQKQGQELEVLHAKRQSIDSELLALEQAYIDIYLRIKQVEKGADLKKAIREGAVLEVEMKKLMDTIAASKLDVENCQNKRQEISKRITQKDKKMSKGYKLAEINQLAIKKEELTDAERARRELFEYYILISTHQKEIDDINSKIEEHESAIVQLAEESVMLDGVKEALMKYIKDQKKNKETLEVKLIELKARNTPQAEQNGQSDTSLTKMINTVSQDLVKANKAIDEYDEKLYYIKQREGGLQARTKITKTYLSSLKESGHNKQVIIQGLLSKAGVSDFYQLTEILDSAEDQYKQLYNSNQDLEFLSRGLEDWQEDTAFLQNQIDTIDNEQLPLLIARHSEAVERLKICQSEYDALKEIIGDQPALERFDEVTLSEKEYDTLKKDLADKRIKISDFFAQKQRVLELISLLESKSRKVFLDGKEYDYPALNVKVIGDSISGEVLKEIRECEARAEELKTELLAIGKVLNDYMTRRDKNLQELQKLTVRLDSDREILDQIMSDFSEKLSLLQIEDIQELRKNILSEGRKKEIKEEIASYNGLVVLYEHKISVLKKIIEENNKHIELLEEYKHTIQQLDNRYEEIGLDIANITAKRTEMKSRASQLFALKEKLNKYSDKLKVLGEIITSLKANGDITDYIVKLASKKLYGMTTGKYNLDMEDNGLVLYDNKIGGKSVSEDAYTAEEKFLMSLVLGVSLHRTLIDMIGGEPVMLLFPLKEQAVSKTTAPGVANYVKKEKIMVLVTEEKMAETFTCTG